MNGFHHPPPQHVPAGVASSHTATVHATQPQQPPPQPPHHSRLCIRCHHPNPDIVLPSCHCTLHARCTPVPIRACPNPHHGHIPLHPVCPLELLPMDFTELDDAKKLTAGKRGKERAKKKPRLDDTTADDAVVDASDPANPAALSSDLRTGRWTTEETAHCDNLIHQFMSGRLPLPDGLKLNEFLANMLKSKQSRLTKKMKNAKLSSKTFKRTVGYLAEEMEARSFSDAEMAFFASIQSPLERAEMKFHIAKEWRETFSTYCVSHGQSLNVDHWLASVEEMDRRNQRAKEMERVRRREMMMGCALRQDSLNPDRGVMIENVKSGEGGGGSQGGPTGIGSSYGAVANESPHPDPVAYSSESMMDANGSAMNVTSTSSFHSGSTMHASNSQEHLVSSSASPISHNESSSQNAASPFLHKIVAYIHRHHVPFEYIDAWVPSFVPDTENDTQEASDQPKCRLCFAGSMVTKQVILETNTTRRAVPLSPEDQFNLSSFGDYSESFSFDVGCGLPGRVYHMGVPTWEQSVHNAPLNHFERVGGAQQWGIRTVVGIPVPSPNVGRVVVVLYSRYDRVKDHDLVIRLTEEFTRLMPSPKWKLVVDVGETQAQGPSQQQQQNGNAAQNGGSASCSNGNDNNALTAEVISIFGEHMPSDPSNPGFAYLQGFMSLRLLLLRTTRTEQEQDIVNTILSSYSSYKAGGRTRPDMALMLARDFMFLNQQHQAQSQQQILPQQQHQPQQQMNGHQGMQSFLPVGNNHPNAATHNNQYHASFASQNMSATPAPMMASNQSHNAMGPNGAMSYSSAPSAPSNHQQYTQQFQHLTQHENDSYYMMGDIEPSPISQDQNQPQSPLSVAVDNVETLLAPDDTGSNV
ncbi:hypothetical protein HJC23_012777 [Cyclotella cryptica]|uniref:Uncharacterized protein n=1 Tax=Cyclotella cryptica TaxID=29204 RepID=A0ABD3Q442_9STRA